MSDEETIKLYRENLTPEQFKEWEEDFMQRKLWKELNKDPTYIKVVEERESLFEKYMNAIKNSQPNVSQIESKLNEVSMIATKMEKEFGIIRKL